MFMVYAMLGTGFFFLSWAMTNLVLGLVATVAIPLVALKSNAFNGFLVGAIIAGIGWGNLPLFESHGHDDGHGHAHPDEQHFWDPWGIAYRAVATVIALAALTGFTLAISDASTQILWMARADLASTVIATIRLGAGCMALLTAYVVAINYANAQAQG